MSDVTEDTKEKISDNHWWLLGGVSLPFIASLADNIKEAIFGKEAEES
jgi:hypothetical protein